MRIDRARLTRETLPFRCEIATRFADLDVIGHVNNVAAAAILQEGRNRFIHHCELFKLAHAQLVVASTLIEYAGDLLHPAPIEVCVGVLEIGRSSVRLGQIAWQHDRVGVYAEVVQVTRDERGAAPLPDAWRTRLEAMRIA
ncbi:MAG TPA: thioesterase family protein [Solimonas sp.]|nr:thioesterase family protein [Solimonas sp.]